jgi:glycoside hydrolase family 31
MNGIYRYTYGIPEEKTPSSVFAYKLDEKRCASLPSPAAPFAAGDVVFRHTVRGCTLEIPLESEAHVFGFGLQMKSFDQSLKKKTLRVNSDPVADTGDSHAPVPMYLSTTGYAVLVDTARYASFYMGSHVKMGQKDAAAAGGGPADNTEELYASREIEGRRHVLVDIPTAEGVTLFVFAGPTMLDAVRRYNLFSGGGYLPPMWGLGIWYRTYMDSTQETVKAQCRQLREERLPCDVFGLEPRWQTQAYSCSYVFNEKNFPDPDALVADLGEDGFRLNLWEHVFIHPASPIYDEMQPYAGSYEVWGGLVPDLSLPSARDVFAGYHKKTLVDKGISGFKLDECDNSDFIGSPWSFPEASAFPSGLDGEQMHSLLGGLYQRTMLEAFEDTGRRTLCGVRSSGPFLSDMPFVLYSDLYDHKDFIRSLVNAGFTGLSWTPEVRQCASVEDLYRRIQTVIFSPMALVNGWMIPHFPWKQVDEGLNKQNVFLDNAEEVTARVRSLFELRMRFVPYLYTAYRDYETSGIPPFRALVMDHPDDPQTYACDLEYMMGDSLLVAPLVEGETERAVYLPQGDWFDFHTGERLTGGRWLTIQADITTIPLFVKDGTLLPLADPVLHFEKDGRLNITVYRYGKGTLCCRLFEDDGETTAYRSGICNTVSVVWKAGDAAPHIAREGGYEHRRYQFPQAAE